MMCGVTRTHDVRPLRGGRATLRQRLGIPSMQRLIATRTLRWAGHVVRMDGGRLLLKFFSSWIKGVIRPRGRCTSYGHDLARGLQAVRANLDTEAQAVGVSRDWVAQAQDLDVWRRVVAEDSCSCLNNEGGTPSGVAQPCIDSVSDHRLSVQSRADANPSSTQSSLAAHSSRAREGRLHAGPPGGLQRHTAGRERRLRPSSRPAAR